jgi:hypothetical protein
MQNTDIGVIFGSKYGYSTPRGEHKYDQPIMFFYSFYSYSVLVYFKLCFIGIRHISRDENCEKMFLFCLFFRPNRGVRPPVVLKEMVISWVFYTFL